MSVYVNMLLLFSHEVMSDYESMDCSMYVNMHVCLFADVFAILWTVASQAPLSMGFPRQEH